jgi:hypothetical protein
MTRNNDLERLRVEAEKALREAQALADNARQAKKKADSAERAYLLALLEEQGQLTIFQEE